MDILDYLIVLFSLFFAVLLGYRFGFNDGCKLFQHEQRKEKPNDQG